MQLHAKMPRISAQDITAYTRQSASKHIAFHMRHPIMYSADLQTTLQTQDRGLEVVSGQLILLQKLHGQLPKRIHGLAARHVRSYTDAEPSNPNAGILEYPDNNNFALQRHRLAFKVQDGTGTFADFLLVAGALSPGGAKLRSEKLEHWRVWLPAGHRTIRGCKTLQHNLLLWRR